MVKRVFGKIDGMEVNYTRDQGDWWNIPIPLDRDGEYIIEVIAEDEAGNQTFMTRLLYTVKSENVCVHKLQLPGYLFERIERFAIERDEEKIHFDLIHPQCREVQC